ncbi:MAG: hypothetical protein M1823_004186 [Watsoniomyces obsoletus]|nr:MAG: hypothetical protein M1823_004186 [Watsoniomyces obsoletus]
MSLCYQPRKLGAFWRLIAVLFSGETGKHLRDPCRTVEELTAQRKITIKQQEMESGRLQEATELSNALDCWLEVLKGYEDAIDEKGLNQEQAEEETRISQQQTEALLVSIGRRRRPREETASEDDDVNKETGKTRLSVSPNPPKGRKRSRGNAKQEEIAAVNDMTGALNNIAGAVSQMSTSVAPLEERVNRLEQVAENSEQSATRRHQELSDMLRSMK